MANVKSQRHSTRRTFLNISRVVLFWYTLVTISVRCPNQPSDLTDDSPWMCKPYFETRDVVKPYVTPIYNAYAAPYVDMYVTPYFDTYINPGIKQVQPYAQHFEKKVYTPTRRSAKKQYTKLVEPWIELVKNKADTEWDRLVKPHTDKYLAQAHVQYQQYLEPHILRTDLTLRPLLLRLQGIAMQLYFGRIVPSYQLALPRVQIAIIRVRAFVLTVIYPYVRSATQTTSIFITRRIWPTIRVLYGQNVEPQLAKIRQRLSSYRDSKKLLDEMLSSPTPESSSSATPDPRYSATPEPVTSTTFDEVWTSVVPNPIASFFSGIYTASSSASDVEVTATSELPMPASSEPSMPSTSALPETTISEFTSVIASSTEQPTISPITSSTISVVASSDVVKPMSTGAPYVTDDLNRWKAKFKVAAERGSEDLSSRVIDICTRQHSSQLEGVGQALLIQLEEAAEDAISSIKSAILSAISASPSPSPDQDHLSTSDPDKDTTIEDLHNTIRTAGQRVKSRAQALREWRLDFTTSTNALIHSATRSTLSVLDSIRDLGLQDIGMRWASMDNVAYRDWADYHALKETFAEWRAEVERVATEHELVAKSVQEVEDLEERGMAIAEHTARELARLKGVAVRKVREGDGSDDFETKGEGVGAAAKRVGRQILDKIGVVASSKSETETTKLNNSIMSDTTAIATTAQSLVEDIIVPETAPPPAENKSPLPEELINMVPTGVTSVIDTLSQGTDSVSSLFPDVPTEALTEAASSLAQASPLSSLSSLLDLEPATATASLSITDSATSALSAVTPRITNIPDPLSSLSSSIDADLDLASLTDHVKDAIISPASSVVDAATVAISSTFSSPTEPSSSSFTQTESRIGINTETPLGTSHPTAPSLAPNIYSTIPPSAHASDSTTDTNTAPHQTSSSNIGDSGSSITTTAIDSINSAISFSESLKRKIASATDAEDIRSLTSRLVDEL